MDQIHKYNKPLGKWRIFIVGDHAMFRDDLQQLIDREPDLTVCGAAAATTNALEGISESEPDLVIVEITLCGESGIELIKVIKDEYEDVPVLVISMHEESLCAERALRAGALGYVMKQEPVTVVKTAIRKVLAGDIHLSEKMAGSVISKCMRGTNNLHASPLEMLSDRELEVFWMLGLGKKVRQIAEEMNMCISSINTFRDRIKKKLQLRSSREVVLHAFHWSCEESRQRT